MRFPLAAFVVLAVLASGCSIGPEPAPFEPGADTKVEQPVLPQNETFSKPAPIIDISEYDGQGTTETVTPEDGGTIEAPDGHFSVTIPPGALAKAENVTLRERAPAEYSIEPAEIAFSKPLLINLTVDAGNLSRANLSQGWPIVDFGVNGTGRPTDVKQTFSIKDATLQIVANTTQHRWSIETSETWLSLSPYDVTAFVGETWTATAQLKGPRVPAFAVGNVTVLTGGPIEQVSPPAQTSRATLSDPTPFTFRCLAAGLGLYGISLEILQLDAAPTRVFALEAAHCVVTPKLTATLTPPRTLFRVDADLPTETDERPRGLLVAWEAAISCGQFVASGERNVTARRVIDYPPTLDRNASWSHPNAPTKEAVSADVDKDGIPDNCPHSETPNFSHAGLVNATLHYRRAPPPGVLFELDETEYGDPFYDGEVECTYSGSLAGNGTCTPRAFPDLVVLLRAIAAP